MSASIYSDKNIVPTNKMLSNDLAETKIYFDNIATFIEKDYGNFKSEWKFYNQKSGWVLKMFSLKRNVFFVIPCYNYFGAAFTLGEKAFELVLKSELPDAIKKELSEAKKYAEGRSIRIDVKTKNDFNTIVELIKVKMMK